MRHYGLIRGDRSQRAIAIASSTVVLDALVVRRRLASEVTKAVAVVYAERMDSSRIAAIPFFAGLAEDELAAVAAVASEAQVPSGQALAAEGRIGHSLFAIESGTADVVKAGETVGTVGPGDVVGEIAVYASPPDPFAPPEVAEGGLRTASVIATSPMRIIALYKRDVWRLDQRAPGVTQRLRAVLDERRVQEH